MARTQYLNAAVASNGACRRRPHLVQSPETNGETRNNQPEHGAIQLDQPKRMRQFDTIRKTSTRRPV